MMDTILSEIARARKQVNLIVSGAALSPRGRSVQIDTGLFAKEHFCDTLLWGRRGVPSRARRI